MPIPYQLRYTVQRTSCDVPYNEHFNVQCSSMGRHVSNYTNQPTTWCPVLRETQFLRLSTNSHFIEVCKNPLPVPINPLPVPIPSLIQFTPSHPTSFNSHFNIILPSRHRSSKRSPSVRFPHQNSVRMSLLHHMYQISHPPQVPSFFYAEN